MADHAIAYDSRPEEATYESVLINTVTYQRGGEGESTDISKCARLLQGNFGSRIWAPIRTHERFRNAVLRMEAYK